MLFIHAISIKIFKSFFLIRVHVSNHEKESKTAIVTFLTVNWHYYCARKVIIIVKILKGAKLNANLLPNPVF